MAAGERVKRARESADMTQDALAEKCNISRSMVAHIETNRKRITYELANTLAAALGVNFTQFYTKPKKKRAVAK